MKKKNINEIERKFLVKSKPGASKCIDTTYIEQMYLSKEFNICIRRQTKPFKNRSIINHYLIIKSEGDLVRKGTVIEIEHNSYIDLSNNIEGKIIEKLRKTYSIENNLIAELDIYKSIPDLITVEVEFKTLEEANEFIPPIWFGKEITNDQNYKNKNLAK